MDFKLSEFPTSPIKLLCPFNWTWVTFVKAYIPLSHITLC